MVNTNTVLSSILFSQTIDWNIKQFFNSTTIKSFFELKRIGKAITRCKEQMVVEDGKKYKRITIKTNCGGVVVRDEVWGKEIKTKKQYYVRSGQLAVSKIDARNGAFGIVPPEADGAIITGNFWVYDVNPEMANIEYLVLLLSSDAFVNAWQDCSNGGGNRLYLQEEKFLNYRIPMPDVTLQNKIMKKHTDMLIRVRQLEYEALERENSIEKFVINSLNIGQIEKLNNSNILRFVPFQNFSNKWEWSEISESIEKAMKSCAYQVKTLGQTVSFVNRIWKSKSYNNEKFMYIEIGGIDSANNIATANEVFVADAPSRATQTVESGDLIIGTTRPYLKKFAIIRDSENGYVCSSGFQVIKPSSEYDLRYIMEVLKIETTIKQFELLMTGALYPAINFEQLKQIKIPVPPIDVQVVISNHIEQEKMSVKNLYEKAKNLRRQAKTEFEEAVFSEA